jgi:hypothetical protein
MDTDLKGAMIQIGKAMNDPIKGMAALAQSGVSFTGAQQKMIEKLQKSGDIVGAQKIILEELKGEFGGAAVAMGDTFGGKMTQLWNKLGDIGEAIGSALIPVLADLAEWLSTIVDWVGDNEDTIQEWGEVLQEVGHFIGGYLVEALKLLATNWVTQFTAIEYAVKNWSDVMDLAWTTVQYGGVNAFNVLSYYLTDVVPGYLKWFGDNWGKVLTDMMNYAGTVFENMGANIQAFFEAFWSWLKGDGFDFQWTSLSKGFEATLKELPQIAEREIGPLEETLGRHMDELGKRMGGDFSNLLGERLAALGLVPGVEPSGGKGQNELDINPRGGPRNYKYTARGSEKTSGFEDLSALYKRIAGAAGKDPAAQTADNTEELVKQSKEQTNALKMIAGKASAPTPLNTGTPGWATEEM